MRLTKNIVSNYFNQLWIALANIISIPLYLTVLGNNSIGLIGFFTALQGVFSIFDLGFAPIVSQESKKSQLQKITQKSFLSFIKTTNCVYLIISIIIFICLLAITILYNDVSDTIHVERFVSKNPIIFFELNFFKAAWNCIEKVFVSGS